MIRIIDSREAELIKPIEPINNTSITKNEVRYSSLVKKNPEAAKEVLELNKQDAIKRYQYYKKLSEEKSE